MKHKVIDWERFGIDMSVHATRASPYDFPAFEHEKKEMIEKTKVSLFRSRVPCVILASATSNDHFAGLWQWQRRTEEVEGVREAQADQGPGAVREGTEAEGAVREGAEAEARQPGRRTGLQPKCSLTQRFVSYAHVSIKCRIKLLMTRCFDCDSRTLRH